MPNITKEQYTAYNHSEAGREARRRYKKTLKGHYRNSVSHWGAVKGMKLRQGEDWESIYIQWLVSDECMFCDKDIRDTKKQKCLDHDHVTGFIRGVICKQCNHYRNEQK